MATIAELLVKIGANSSELRKEVAATQRQLKRAFGPEALAASQKVATGLMAIATAAGIAGIAGIGLAGKIKKLTASFETLTGSREEAEKMIKSLRQLDDASAFDFDTFSHAAQKLLAMGTATDQVIPTLTIIGDAVAALGGDAQNIDRITLALSQMSAKGKVSAQEMNQLAEQSISGWKYLAEATGKTIPEVMKLAEKGMLDGREAVKTILAGMEKDYKGSMRKIENDTTQVWETIKSNAGQILAEVGAAIDKNLGVNDALIALRDWMVELKNEAGEDGLLGALRKMVPDSAKIAIAALGAAITSSAIPALVNMASKVKLLTGLFGPWGLAAAVAGAAIAAVAIAIDNHRNAAEREAEAMQKTSKTYSQLITEYKNLKSQANLTADEKQRLVDISNQIAEIMPQVVAAYDEEGNAIIDLNAALKAEVALKKDILTLENQSLKKRIANLEKEIETEKRVLEIDRDLYQRNAALIAQKHERVAGENAVARAQEQGARKVREHIKNIEDMEAELKNLRAELKQNEALLSGKFILEVDPQKKDPDNKNEPPLIKPEDTEKAFKKIKEKGEQVSEQIRQEWVQTTKTQLEQLDIWREEQIAALDEIAKGYEAHGKKYEDYQRDLNRIDAVYAERRKKILEEENKHKDALDEARRQGKIAAFAEELASERALMAADLAARQEMIDLYYELWQETHRTSMSYMAEAMDGLYSGLTDFFADVINNAKSIGDAWDSLRSKFLTMLGQMVAQWLSSRIMMWATEKLFGGKQLGLAMAQGAATASAWAPAAAMVSLATMGGNAAAAMSGITMTTGLAVGLAKLPALKEGGITTGPTIAEIGEGRYKEAVMPLNRKTFEKVGLVGDKQEREPIYIQPVIQAWDGQSVDQWLNNGGGAKLEKYFKKRVRSFVPVEA